MILARNMFFLGVFILMLSSCTSINRTMREPRYRVMFKHDDFVFSQQVKGEAREVKVFGTDWSRLLTKKNGTIETDNVSFQINWASIPVIGGFFNRKNRPIGYALHDLMQVNPGFDVIIYPQFEITTLNVLGVVKVTDVKVKARLGRIDELE